MAARTASYGAGGKDAWVLKLTSAGAITWQKTYGGASDDSAYNVLLTDDGGYLVTGTTVSFGTSTNTWVLKLDATGRPVYTLGGTRLGQDTTAASSIGTLTVSSLGYAMGNLSDFGSEADTNAASAETWSTWTQYP